MITYMYIHPAAGDLSIKTLVAEQRLTNKIVIKGCVHAQNTACACAPIYHPLVNFVHYHKLHSHGYIDVHTITAFS